VAGITNKCKAEMLDVFYRGDAGPTSFFLALVTNSPAPTATTNILSDLTEIAPGNGYELGGQPVARTSAGFPLLEEDDSGDKGIVGLKEFIFLADGGVLPSDGVAARFAVLTDNQTPQSSRKVYLYFDLDSDVLLSDGQQLTINGMNTEIIEP